MNPTAQPDRIRILGLPIDNVSMEQALERIEQLIERPGPALIFFLNAHCANIACRDAEYRRALQAADLVLADGSGLALAGRMLGRPIVENVNGTDLFPLLMQRLAKGRRRVFLLGAKPGVAARVGQWLGGGCPPLEAAGWSGQGCQGLRVMGWHDGFFDAEGEERLLHEMRTLPPNLLLVAMGVPRQELWLARNLELCRAGAGMAVGGLFDFYSGRIPRAPARWRRLGVEWIWRLIQEPGRMWRRYILGNFLFLHRVLRERLGRWP